MNCSKQPSETAVPFFLTPFVVVHGLEYRPTVDQGGPLAPRSTNSPDLTGPINCGSEWPHSSCNKKLHEV